ncbi:hypothetical protein [Microbispora bryophytorum]|uniref:hypothetical protein n=1 Tax=Microbispora bryophytorum TaxID=1460882 RepID=UPI0033D83FCA
MTDSFEERLRRLEQVVQRLVETVGGASDDTETVSHRLDQQALEHLASKLDQFSEQLSHAEKATLLSVLGAAAVKFEEAAADGSESIAIPEGIEVFTRGPLDQVSLGDALIGLGNIDRGPAARLPGSGIDPVADAVNVGGDVTCVHGDWTKDLAADALTDRARWVTGPDLGRLGSPGKIVPGQAGGFESKPRPRDR